MNKDDVRISKTLSLWLRHDPGKAGLTLDEAGWTDVDAVLGALGRVYAGADWETLTRVVETNDKQRFELSPAADRIRARQGHSVEVTLDWPVTPPPERLYHGTVDRFLQPILADGLKPMARHHVHLSPDLETARKVGTRRGKPVILVVDAAAMTRDGHSFLLTGNGVWLTDAVAARYLSRLD